MQALSRSLKAEGKTLGLVPTMGFLHEGHLSLVRASKAENDITIVSIFVNPTQFAPNEDFGNYPRDFERDKTLLEAEGTDIIFNPSVDDIYPADFSTYVTAEGISHIGEGEFRPAHFKGVTTIVMILFNSTLADHSYFGQKDAQQAAILMKMVRELCIPVVVHIMPIVREADGLARSSRNIYLSERERADALVLSASLAKAKEMLVNGEHIACHIKTGLQNMIQKVPTAEPDYVRIVSAETFHEAQTIEEGKTYFVLLACRFGKARLIDNLFVDMRGHKKLFS